MHLANGLAWLGFALLRALPAAAIYRDEAFRIDYQHALLGAPVRDNTFFYQPTLSSKATLLYTLSERNVVGAVNPKDGSLVWRQKLEKSPLCDQHSARLLGAANGTNSVVSAYGSSVIAWEAASGRMLWTFEETGCVQSLVVPDIPSKTQDPIVLMNDDGAMRLTALNAINGKVVWQVTEDVGDLPLAVAAGSSHIYYIALQPVKSKGYNVKVVSVHAESARPTGEETLSTAGDITSVASLLHIAQRSAHPFIAWTDKAQRTIKLNILGTSQITTLQVPKSDEPIEHISIHVPNSPQALGHFLISYETASGHWAEAYSIDGATKEIKQSFVLPRIDGPGTFSISTIGINVFFVRVTDKSVMLHFAASSNVLEGWDISGSFKDARNNSEGIGHITAEVVTRGMSNYALRAATTFLSDDWMLMRNGQVEWLRSESLAGVVSAAWAEAPAADDLVSQLAIESHNNVVSAYIHRLTRHAKDLKYLPSWLRRVPTSMRASLTGASVKPMTAGTAAAQSFGFQKLVVVATGKGRMMAIDTSAGGRVLWSTKVAELEPEQRWNVSDILIAADSVVALAHKGEAVTLDLSTGAVRDHKLADTLSKVANTFPVSTASGTSALLSVSHDGSLIDVPDMAFGEEDYIVTRSSAGPLFGWTISNEKANKVWTFSPPDGEEVVIVSKRPAHDPVASIGRALGDRNVLYKYLSPNLLLVITANAVASTARVTLLDAVSGSTLHTTQHSGIDATRPIAATLSENWFAYSLFSDPSLVRESAAASQPKGYVLTVAELFESNLPNDRGALSDAANFSSVVGKPYFPYVVSASYVLPTEISYLTTTSTRQGITPRSLLAYCPAQAAIVAIPFPILSPRKPVGRDPTTAEREEGLFRYAPQLDIPPMWTISHAREVLGIKALAVTPTLMESTSLVFAYGELDVFGTRLAPIGAFDILGNGFGKVQLILTVMALAVGTSFLAPMVRRKQIDSFWKS